MQLYYTSIYKPGPSISKQNIFILKVIFLYKDLYLHNVQVQVCAQIAQNSKYILEQDCWNLSSSSVCYWFPSNLSWELSDAVTMANFILDIFPNTDV